MASYEMKEYLDKVVIVTGGGSGIGRGLCQAFAAQGAKVIIAEIDEKKGKELEEILNSSGYIAHFIHTDMGNLYSIKAMVEKVEKMWGKIDVLINNAAIAHNAPLWERDDRDWERVIAVNLSGPYYAAKYSSKLMAKGNGGVIINIASTRAFMSEKDTEPYSASKGGIIALTHSLAISLGEYNIRVNSISPGWIHTGEETELTEGDHRQHPIGRVGKIEDVVAPCLYLASGKAGFITGENIVIDGGMTKKMIYI
ncbi:hypothetical protein SAMN02745227_01921 [Anaerobranca californiensis DSM 14826]|uniref:NAD(P)-dependent dehydrogenase, short-chain alcohol dehydrogenase family n=1 Tax=Anaerobranca californiensis DSM 14826 TaxID=1120989 RepID=A0A1M6R1V6_9FIRM|nr:glucose 1-dehydrogenase [Anaerobranca californiensis]SHK26337.1 hypothetical protein SAMN02745227_01921 [Anaerobranca californiensis DSM 14826]